MIGDIILYSIIGLVALMALGEVRRYRAAREDEESIAYPTGRLRRRMGIAVLTLGVLLAIAAGPPGESPSVALLWYSLCFIGLLIIVILGLRDLRETSIAVVAAHQQFQKEAREKLRETIEECPKRKRRQKGRR